MSLQTESLVLKNWSFGFPYSGSIIASLFAFFDILSIAGTGLGMYLLYAGWNENTYSNYLLASGLVAIATIGSLYSTGSYRSEAMSGVWQQVGKVLSVCVIVYLLFLAILFGLKISAMFSRVWVFLWFSTGTSLMCLSRVCVRSLLSKWGRLGKITRNIVIVGKRDQALRLSEHLSQERQPWNRVVRVVHDGMDDGIDEDQISGCVDDLIAFAREHRVDDIIVTLPLSADERLFISLVTKLKELPANIHFTCDLAGFKREQLHCIGGVPLIDVAQKPLSGWNFIVKELEDKVVAGILLPLLAPALTLIALAIKVNSPGPVLFRQARHGRNNKVFVVYKFRTMYCNECEETTVKQAQRNDPRVTRVGHFLRRTSLDELPQLFNVLLGSMSLVGPRPHALTHNIAYSKSIVGFLSRHRIKPGITGWAQVNGLRGETDSPEKIRKRLEYDLYYIENWSLLFDIRILVMTLFVVVFLHKNAY